MNISQDKPNLQVVVGTNPVALARAYAKARSGCAASTEWLISQHQAGNRSATKALEDLAKLHEKAVVA